VRAQLRHDCFRARRSCHAPRLTRVITVFSRFYCRFYCRFWLPLLFPLLVAVLQCESTWTKKKLRRPREWGPFGFLLLFCLFTSALSGPAVTRFARSRDWRDCLLPFEGLPSKGSFFENRIERPFRLLCLTFAFFLSTLLGPAPLPRALRGQALRVIAFRSSRSRPAKGRERDFLPRSRVAFCRILSKGKMRFIRAVKKLNLILRGRYRFVANE